MLLMCHLGHVSDEAVAKGAAAFLCIVANATVFKTRTDISFLGPRASDQTGSTPAVDAPEDGDSEASRSACKRLFEQMSREEAAAEAEEEDIESGPDDVAKYQSPSVPRTSSRGESCTPKNTGKADMTPSPKTGAGLRPTKPREDGEEVRVGHGMH